MTGSDAALVAHAAPTISSTNELFSRVVMRGVTIIDGSGAPAEGPVDLVIEREKIAGWFPAGQCEIVASDRVLELAGHTVLPGFIDAHGHIDGPSKAPGAHHIYDLWLAHGVTTVRELGAVETNIDFVVNESRRAAAGHIRAPQIQPFALFGAELPQGFRSDRDAHDWVQKFAERGAAGVKFFGHRAEIMSAAIEAARSLGLGTAAHLAQRYVADVNALDAARMGLQSVEHFYGIAEAMLPPGRVQQFPDDYSYLNEQSRFREAGRLWAAAYDPVRTSDVIDELIDLGTTLVPTFNIYIGMRDAARVRNSEWHGRYTVPELWDFWTPSKTNHGSAWWDWTTHDEIAWRRHYRLWMDFVAEFSSRGGRVAAGSDSGFIYKLHGFGFIEELELLAEAGLSALEVVRAATAASAQLLGISDTTGRIAPGRVADLVVVDGNPLANLKLLYGTGHSRLNEHDQIERTGGVKFTVRSGMIYDSSALLEGVANSVLEARERAHAVTQPESAAGTDGGRK